MSLLIDIDPVGNIVLRPACLKLYPQLSTLTEKEVVFLVKAFDYHYKALRRYNEQDRVRRAILDVWEDNNPKLLADYESGDPHRRINTCISAYKALQYNPKEELANGYQRKIDQLQVMLETAETTRDIKSILDSISEVRKSMMALNNEIYEQTLEMGQIKGEKELSYLEIIQANAKLYETTRNTKPVKKTSVE